MFSPRIGVTLAWASPSREAFSSEPTINPHVHYFPVHALAGMVLEPRISTLQLGDNILGLILEHVLNPDFTIGPHLQCFLHCFSQCSCSNPFTSDKFLPEDRIGLVAYLNFQDRHPPLLPHQENNIMQYESFAMFIEGHDL